MAKGFGGASMLVKLGVVLTAVGLLLYIIGMATPYWTYVKVLKAHNGLWRSCFVDLCGNFGIIPSWLEASRAFAIIGVLAGFGSLILILLNLLVDQLDKKVVYIVAFLLGFAACGCALLAVIIYGSKRDNYLHWSFGLTIVGALFHGAAALLLAIGMMQKS